MQIMKKALLTISLLTTLTACQLVSPIFVEYNGVRMDVAKWINQQPLMTMQQKRTLAQLSRAQQKLVKIDQITEHDKVAISTQNAIALYCTVPINISVRERLCNFKIRFLIQQIKREY